MKIGTQIYAQFTSARLGLTGLQDYTVLALDEIKHKVKILNDRRQEKWVEQERFFDTATELTWLLGRLHNDIGDALTLNRELLEMGMLLSTTQANEMIDSLLFQMLDETFTQVLEGNASLWDHENNYETWNDIGLKYTLYLDHDYFEVLAFDPERLYVRKMVSLRELRQALTPLEIIRQSFLLNHRTELTDEIIESLNLRFYLRKSPTAQLPKDQELTNQYVLHHSNHVFTGEAIYEGFRRLMQGRRREMHSRHLQNLFIERLKLWPHDPDHLQKLSRLIPENTYVSLLEVWENPEIQQAWQQLPPLEVGAKVVSQQVQTVLHIYQYTYTNENVLHAIQSHIPSSYLLRRNYAKQKLLTLRQAEYEQLPKIR